MRQDGRLGPEGRAWSGATPSPRPSIMTARRCSAATPAPSSTRRSWMSRSPASTRRTWPRLRRHHRFFLARGDHAAARCGRAARKKPLVIGTTGFSDDGEDRIIEAASRGIPVIFSPNMSLGVNLLFKLTEIAAAGARRPITTWRYSRRTTASRRTRPRARRSGSSRS